MRTNPISLFALLTFIPGLLINCNAAPRYRVIDLGSLGGLGYRVNFAVAPGKLLNDHGIVAAGMYTADEDPICLNNGCRASHAFLWNKGTLYDLGLLTSGAQANFSQSFSVNEQNNCVGMSTINAVDSSGAPLFRAVMWKSNPGTPPQLVGLGGLGGNQSLAQAINNQDQAVGWALNQTPAMVNIWESYPWPFGTQQRAVLWHDGMVTDLGTLGGPSAWASDINDRGQIIGQSFTETGSNGRHQVEDISWSRKTVGFLWENGNMIDLGNVGGTYMLPLRINNQGQISGNMAIKGDASFHPFLWANGVLTDLGTFGGGTGLANAMNELGEVVGRAETSPGVHRAFLWRNGELKNLGTLGANSQAWTVNEKGQVVGTSGRTLNEPRAFLWENGGPMRDLNDLVPPGSPHLAEGININNRGEILVGGLNEKGLYLLVPLPALTIRHAETSSGPKVIVEAQTLPGRTYRLDRSSALGNWEPPGPSFIAEQETTTWEFESGSERSFYRIAGPL